MWTAWLLELLLLVLGSLWQLSHARSLQPHPSAAQWKSTAPATQRAHSCPLAACAWQERECAPLGVQAWAVVRDLAEKLTDEYMGAWGRVPLQGWACDACLARCADGAAQGVMSG